jgi:hypothetical protein
VTIPLADDVVVHRVGGGGVGNLRLTSTDRAQTPPGLSVLLGGTPQEAADAMRLAYPGSRKWRALAGVVGSAGAGAIRAAGFDVIPVPTDNFPNHARITHPGGPGGFTDAHLAHLSAAFADTTGC